MYPTIYQVNHQICHILLCKLRVVMDKILMTMYFNFLTKQDNIQIIANKFIYEWSATLITNVLQNLRIIT